MAKRPIRIFYNNGNPYIIIKNRRLYIKDINPKLLKLIKKKGSMPVKKRYPIIKKEQLKQKFINKVAKRVPRYVRPREQTNLKKIIED